ncbi:MAG: vanadium-dependent haloperoxidase [Cyclobacteriaceae bacterium]|nr:vanadium-dependent haloperoxidase [Cyclobacteriaceae bacterium HetDA_MAG_MS6]
MKKLSLLPILLVCLSCEPDLRYQKILADPETYQSAMKRLTDIIVYDIFSPPVASRVYVYPNIAAYEVARHSSPEKYASLSGQLADLTETPTPGDLVDINLASLHAFLTVGKALIFSEEKIDNYANAFYQKLTDHGLPSSVKSESLAFGEQVASHILKWTDGDMYKQTRTYPKYTVRSEQAYWKPTPPDYMEGIEPHWREIRTLVLDSAEQYPPIPPLPFDMTSGSTFHTQLMEVYDIGKSLDQEQTEIAEFWDCNPYVSHHRGHAMFATKKITPGGHWMGITAIATRQAESSFDETVEAYARTSIALFDAFISCWDEKWKSLMVRPETLINEHLDEDWLPLLQTPPFPEYTSGHSVISRAAAVTLTDIFGDDFSFNDTTEVEYGLTERKFNSFMHASEEAAISRLYGGIHYMMAIENGVDQGQKVGEHIVRNLKTRR